MDLQPYDELPEVLATGDVLIALIERDAGTFAVPSKVLSYLCAARPLLLAVPPSNLAAQTVKRAGAGLIVDPADVDGFIAAARRLVADPGLRARLATSGRRYAEAKFDIEAIADRFERVLYPPPSAGAVKDSKGGHKGWIDRTSFSSQAPEASSGDISSRI
jgi:glycosyltransferase involved in cell wall biosynthesis